MHTKRKVKPMLVMLLFLSNNMYIKQPLQISKDLSK